MSIKVLKGGMQTSIQDLGRPNLMHLGIAQGGVMDALSASLANKLVGNPVTHPVIEVCMLGPALEFSQDMSIAISGAKFELRLESIDKNSGAILLRNNQLIHVNAGDILTFGKRIQGARAYLAFAAELAIDKVLGSYSTHFLAKFGGLHGRAFTSGDIIPLTHCALRKHISSSFSTAQQSYSGSYVLRCTDSVETALFTTAQKNQFYQGRYRVGQASNRMGLRIEGQPLGSLNIADITSGGLLPGSIQIPPSGLPIISSVDGQTIGGYPRIANVISADLFALGQLVPGDTIQFSSVTADVAQLINHCMG